MLANIDPWYVAQKPRAEGRPKFHRNIRGFHFNVICWLMGAAALFWQVIFIFGHLVPKILVAFKVLQDAVPVLV